MFPVPLNFINFLIRSLSFILLIPWSMPCLAEQKPDVKVVEVERAILTNITQTVRLIGTIQAKRSTVLIAKTIGTLDQVAFAGQKISRGGLIAKLENVDLEETCQLSANAEKVAKEQYEHIVQLGKTHLAKKYDVGDRRNQWIEAQKSLAAAKIELDKTRFIAPFDGIVGVFKMREGIQVQVGDPIVTFYDPSELIIEFAIPTPVLQKIYADANQNRDKDHIAIIDGKIMKVSHIQRMIDPDTHMSPAYIDFPCSNCMIGSNILIDFVVVERKGVFVVPFEATFLRDGKMYVYLVKNNKARLCPVTLGVREKERVEITSGLSVGDVVISRAPARLWPDVDVKVFEPSVVEKKPLSS